MDVDSRRVGKPLDTGVSDQQKANDDADSASRLRVENFATDGLGPISFCLHKRECVGLSGPSGAGKSRLLRAIADLDVHEGDAALDGVSRARFTPTQWRRHVGLLPPESHWWSERVRDHFPSVDPEALNRLALDANIIDKPVSQLSSGERQRLALLRLVGNKPVVLLLDEATSNLDRANIALVEEFLAQYQAETDASILWVSHDPEQLGRVAGRRLAIEQGQLIGEALQA